VTASVQAVRLVTHAGAGVAAVLGLLGALAWATPWRWLGHLGLGPMAMDPEVGIALLVLGLALLADTAWPSPRRLAGLSLLVAIASAASLLSFAAGHALALTGAGVALTCAPSSRPTLRDAGGLLALLTLVLSLVVVVGCAFGTPRLLGGPVVPMGPTVALAFAGLATATIVRAGKDRLPLRLVSGPTVRARVLRGFAPLLLAVVFAKWLLYAFVFGREATVSAGLREALESLVVTLVATATAVLVARSVGGAVDGLEDERQRAMQELRRSEEALQASDASLLAAQRMAQIGNWQLDLVRNVLTWSNEIYRIFEIDPREFGASYEAFLAMVHPEDRDSVHRAYTESVRTRAPYEITHRLQMKDGRVKWVNDRCETSYDAEGRPLRSQGTVQDVTERHRSEEQVRATSRYARSLIEASLDPLVTISPDGKVTDVNEATVKATGVARERLIGTDFSSYFTEPQRARSGYEQVFERGYVVDYPLALRHVSGSVMDVLYNASVYRTEGGEVIGVFAAARDVTERKRAEQALCRTLEELKRSNAELEQFAYVASHDLQEPLRMVSSYTQLLARRYRGRLDEDADDFVGFAVDGANRMQRLINDLLAYSRVGTRGRPFGPTDSHAALGQALRNLAAAIDEAGGLVTNDDLPLVLADETQLVLVFQNLVGNAVKFRRPDEPPRVHVSARRDGRMWAFRVRDNGIGIAPEFHARLFTIFQRLHTRDEYPGTGIGLAICKRIVERHGGQIGVESTAGAGSTFVFTIPEAGEAVS
jgi:PAS domain S-box-containing protein